MTSSYRPNYVTVLLPFCIKLGRACDLAKENTKTRGVAIFSRISSAILNWSTKPYSQYLIDRNNLKETFFSNFVASDVCRWHDAVMRYDICRYHDDQIDGLVQDCIIPSALAIDILQSYTKPSKSSTHDILTINGSTIPTVNSLRSSDAYMRQ